MAAIEDFARSAARLTEWRRDLHANPELLYDVHRTAAFVADRLRSFGCDDVVTGIGRTGVVGVLKGRSDTKGQVIALRADMDALPINEITGKPWASKTAGKMHACGHDGHTAMLLGAAEWLAKTRSFDGTAVFIFQPAEEGGAGGKAMVEDGLMERFGIQRVFGMHNLPGLPIGHFAMRTGPIMAAADHFSVQLEGKGGHAAMPHTTVDTTLVAAHLITSLQSIVSRTVDPVESAVLSVTSMRTDTDAYNVIPQTVALKGTVRTLSESVRQDVEARMAAMIETVAAAFGARATLSYRTGYPVTVNHPDETALALETAREIAGHDKVAADCAPMMGAEDFSFMLNARPGAFIFMGNGDSASLHHPAYDFNDDAIPHGVGYWVRLTERLLPLTN
ncbi:M20 aminoacylase family protein [Zhengella sp. ZM62]|uniref:M20 aminoacylase family protein n=1 Tax=Zhengella sedimenti TaxID=3390035 RepID=UPI0039770514